MTQALQTIYQNSIPADKTGIILSFKEAMAISMAKCIEYGAPFEEALMRGEELPPKSVEEAQQIAINIVQDAMRYFASEEQSKEEVLEFAESSLEFFNNCTLPSVDSTEYVNELTGLIERIS